MRRVFALGGLAVLVGSSGCYASHRRGEAPLDAGPLDTGTCTAPHLAGAPMLLTCPERAPAGARVEVGLSHSVDACCRDMATLPVEIRRGRDTPDFGLFPSWSACDCCLTCGCVGTSAFETVSLGPFGAGAVVNVVAGDQHCTIRVE